MFNQKNTILILLLSITLLIFLYFKKPLKELEFFSENCTKKNKEECSKCEYPKLKKEREHCEIDERRGCKKKYNDCHFIDMSKYMLKSKIPACPDMPDLNAYILKSEVPPCPPQPDLSKFVLKTTVPPCRCPPCPKIQFPKLDFECHQLKKDIKNISNELRREKMNANHLKKKLHENKIKIKETQKFHNGYSELDMKKIIKFYEDNNENHNILEKRRNMFKPHCKMVTSDFGSAGSITDPYTIIN